MSIPKTPFARIASKERDTPVSSASPDTESDLSASLQGGVSRRNRVVAVACDSCRKKKIKCDGKRPNCGHCSRKSNPCEYQLPPAERLKAAKARLQNAENELDALKASMTHQASTGVAQTFGEIDSTNAYSSIFSPNLQTQRLSLASFGEGLDGRSTTESMGVTKDVPETGWSLPTRFSAILEVPEYQSYHQSSSSHASQHGGLRTLSEGSTNTIKTPLWQILPMNSVGENETVEPCLLHYLDCRKSLAAGVPMEHVLGPDILDLSCLMTSNESVVVHPFVSWIISYIDVFAGPTLDWVMKLAFIYSMWHLFRWLVYPTEENFNRMPEFMRPTGLQLCVPHGFWINFVIEPSIRDEFVTRPQPNDLQRWASLYLESNIRWSSTKIISPIIFDQSMNIFHLHPEFEVTIRSLENWYRKQA